jgi:predicted nucleotidyltransferase
VPAESSEGRGNFRRKRDIRPPHLRRHQNPCTIGDMDAAAVLTNEEVRAALSTLKERVTGFLGSALLKLVLFGSRAHGDADPDSDVDVAIVVRGLDVETKNRILSTVTGVELEHLVPLSTLILSEEEYRRLLERERRIALDIEHEGVEL